MSHPTSPRLMAAAAWTCLAACAASGNDQRELAAFLRDPAHARAELAARHAELLAAEEDPRPGLRVSRAYHAWRMGEDVDVAALLAAEAARYPHAARFLARLAALLEAAPPGAAP
jgi:hypothetical protein